MDQIQGSIEMNTMMKYMNRLGPMIASLLLCSAVAADAQWKFVEGVYGGPIYALVPSDNYLFAGLLGQGIYRSGDAGSSWTPVARPPLYSSVLAMASDGSIVYAGIDNDIYRTLNDGLTWDTVGRGIAGKGVSPMIAHGHRLFVGRGPGVIYRTDDSGVTWHDASGGLPSTFAASMFAHDGNTLMVSGTRGELYRWLDGETWGEVKPDPASTGQIDGVFGVPGVLIASYQDASVFRSTDGGQSWIRASTSPSYSITSVSGTPGNLHAATLAGIAGSTDGGDHWQTILDLAPEYWYFYGHGTMLVEREGRLLAGSMAGLLGSTDGGYTLRRYDKGIVGESFYALAAQGDVMIAGGQHGTYRSTDGGSTWDARDGMPGAPVSSVYTLGSMTIARCGFSVDWGTFQSMDAGLTWDTLNLPSPPEPSVGLVGIGGYFFTRGKQGALFRQDIHGTSWEDLSRNVRAVAGDTAKVTSLLLSHSMLYIIVGKTKMYRSSDLGNSWQDVNAGLPDGGNDSWWQNYLLTEDNNGQIFIMKKEGVFRLDPTSTSWVSIPMGPFNYDIAIHLAAHDGTLYAAPDGGGVWYLQRGGFAWRKLNDGFYEPIPGVVPNIQMLHVAGDQLFASTDFGLWRRSLAPLSSVEEERPAELRSSVAPNPFAGETTISYTTSSLAHVTLKVFNALGAEVATLLDERQEAGTWRIPFVASGLPAGIYHYRLQIGGRSESGTISLVR